MKDNRIAYTITLILLIVFIVFAYFSGRQKGIDIEKNRDIKKELKTLVVKEKLTQNQIDSIKSTVVQLTKDKVDLKIKDNTVKEKADKIVIDKPKDTVCNDLYNKSKTKIDLLEQRISIKDSIETKSNAIINNQSIMLSKKDSLIEYKNKQIQLISNKKQPSKRFGLGVSVGYGIDIKDSKLYAKPFIGISLNYNLFTF